MPHLHGKGSRQHACGKCDEDIPTWEGVFCDECAEWYHLKCDQLEINCLEAFKDLPEAPYLCRACRCDDKGAFLYTKSLERLHKGAKQGIDKLLKYAEREQQFMKEDLTFVVARSPKYTVDAQAESLLKEFYPGEKKNAAKVPRDGNSLFSAMSLALVGSEKLATELRVRCCIEMVVYDAFHRYQENCSSLARCAPDYTESCLNCATPGEHSCIWTLSALATVVRRCVQSLYPAVNGKLDIAVSILNTEFTPRNRLDDGDAIKILWVGARKVDQALGTWVPEAFVPLVDMPVAPLSPMVVSPYLTPSRVSGRVRKPTAKVLAITNPKIKTEMKVVVQNTEEEEEEVSDPDFTMPSDFTLEPTDEDVFQEKYRMEKVDLDWMDKYTKVAEGGKPLKGTAFLPAQEVFNELTTTEEVCPSIPMGRKEDVFFVVDNSRNLRYKHRRNYFQDDCGRYNQRSGTTCKSFYLLSPDNLLQQLIKDKGKYCKESRRVTASSATPTADSPRSARGRSPARGRGRGRSGVLGSERKVTKWIPMDPQPSENDVVVLHRYYSSLEVDPTYKRRISWFSNLTPELKIGHKSFLVEYITKPIAGLILPDSRKSSSYPGPGEATPEAAAAAGNDVEMAEDVSAVADGSGKVVDQSSESSVGSSQPEDSDTTGREAESESQPMDTNTHNATQEDTPQGGEAIQEASVETPVEGMPVEETPVEGTPTEESQEGIEEGDNRSDNGEAEKQVIIIQQEVEEATA